MGVKDVSHMACHSEVEVLVEKCINPKKQRVTNSCWLFVFKQQMMLHPANRSCSLNRPWHYQQHWRLPTQNLKPPWRQISIFFCTVWHAEWLMENYKWCTSGVCVCKEPFWHQDRCAFLWEWLIAMIETLNYTTFFWGKMLFSSCDIQQQWAVRIMCLHCSIWDLKPFLNLRQQDVKLQQLLSMFVGGFAVAFSNLEELEVDTLVMVATLPPMAFAFAILFAMMVKISSKGYMLLMLKQAQV